MIHFLQPHFCTVPETSVHNDHTSYQYTKLEHIMPKRLCRESLLIWGGTLWYNLGGNAQVGCLCQLKESPEGPGVPMSIGPWNKCDSI